MAQELTTTSLKALFRFPFKEQDWKNRFLVGVLLCLACFIPFLGVVAWVIIFGYVIQVMRRASTGEELELPPWGDWGGLVRDGIQGFLVQIVFMLPGFLVYFGGVLLYFFASFGLPLLFSIPMAGSEGDPSPAAALVLLMVFAVFASMIVLFISIFLGMALMFLGAIPLPMALAHFSVRGNLSAAFRVKEWWPLLRANKLGYFIAWVIVAGLVVVLYWAILPIYLTIILSFLVFVAIAPISFYVLLMGGAVFGRTYWESVALMEARGKEAEG
jgi:hypothetical protein